MILDGLGVMPSPFLFMDKRSLGKLKAEVSRILFEVWDPIGVKEFIEVEASEIGRLQLRSEYASYEQHIVGMVINGSSEQEIGQELDRIACDSMGIFHAGERAKMAARELVALR